MQAQARQFRPPVLIAGYSAYPRKINFATMRKIADDVDAVRMVDMAHFAGLVAGKVFTRRLRPRTARLRDDGDAQVEEHLDVDPAFIRRRSNVADHVVSTDERSLIPATV